MPDTECLINSIIESLKMTHAEFTRIRDAILAEHTPASKRAPTNVYTRTEMIRDDIACHGAAWTAKRAAKGIPFTLFHWMAFGCLPRAKLAHVVCVNGQRILAVPYAYIR